MSDVSSVCLPAGKAPAATMPIFETAPVTVPSMQQGPLIKADTETLCYHPASVSADKARILCMDAHDIPDSPAGRFTKIVSLEQAEHIGVRRYRSFMAKIFNLLDDDGTFVLQVAGLRPSWQYEDLVWGLFMNKYVFPGADASCSLGWVINQVEAVGFEVKSIDVLGVHYSATLHRWYENWMKNQDNCREKYGEKLLRTWNYFLASSVITARQGGSSVFQVRDREGRSSLPVFLWQRQTSDRRSISMLDDG